MTYAELNESVPTLVNIFTAYLTSIYILIILFVILAVSTVIYFAEKNVTTFYYKKHEHLKNYFKEYWLIMLISFFVLNALSFWYHYGVVQENWENEQLQEYFDEQEIIVEEEIPVKRITLYEDNLEKGQAMVLLGDKLVNLNIHVKYEKNLKNPKLTHVELNKDIFYRSSKPLYKKGELVNYTLVLPFEFTDVRVPIRYIGN